MHTAFSNQTDVSVVVPVYNEVENVGQLHRRLVDALSRQNRTFEIVVVDDGSTDGSTERLRALAEVDPRLRLIILRRNFGQTAAMYAGIQHAHGNTIVTIDGDLQNEPDDIPSMLDKLDEGFDLVHGRRLRRQDGWLLRKLPSKIANWIIAKVTRFPVRDLGCTLKAFRREIAQELELYGEMHRFIPILAHSRGARCVEIPTRHHAREFGQTKYGIDRTVRVVLDLITVKYMLKYFSSPMKLFGGFGLMCGGLSGLAMLATCLMKWLAAVDMTGNPLLLLACVTAIASLQFFSLGLLGEVNARIYFANQNKEPYAVRELVNFSSQVSDVGDIRKARLGRFLFGVHLGFSLR